MSKKIEIVKQKPDLFSEYNFPKTLSKVVYWMLFVVSVFTIIFLIV